MKQTTTKPISTSPSSPSGSSAFFVDLVFYLSLMFLIREIYIPSIGFLFNGLFWSLMTLAFASWRMRARGITWAELGLRKPKSIKTLVIGTFVILGMAIGFVVIFQVISEQFSLGLASDTSNESAVDKFGNLKDNWPLFFGIITLVWFESFLEEALDRGFLITWLERMFTSNTVTIILAVILQAIIFGFRHSHDLSERSITVGLIGLAMGIGYIAFGRNLWPLIIAHCALNTISMLERVG